MQDVYYFVNLSRTHRSSFKTLNISLLCFLKELIFLRRAWNYIIQIHCCFYITVLNILCSTKILFVLEILIYLLGNALVHVTLTHGFSVIL
jgi:hypothetical protein